MEINIKDYLNEEDIKEVCKEEIRRLFRDEENAQRLLSNLSYTIVYDEIDKVIPNSRQIVIDKTLQVLNNIQSYSVFRDDQWGKSSLAYRMMEETVINNRDLLDQKVKDAITNKDYSEEIWTKYEELAESFISNFYNIIELGRKK